MPHTHYYQEPMENAVETPSISLERLSVVYTGFMHSDPEFNAQLHTHDFCEILYVLSGNGVIQINGVVYPIKQGDLMVINPGVMHCESCVEKNKLHLVFLAVENFKVDGLKESHLIDRNMPQVIAVQDYRYKIESYFTDILNESADKIMLSTAMTRVLASALLVLILRVYHSKVDQTADLKAECRRIKDYIDKNYTSPITLDSLSEQVYISKYYLAHIFKSQTGTSPIKYLINKRISEAAQLLIHTDLSIRDIALRVGYDDPVYFSQMFKKVMDESPAAYRSGHKA